MIDLSTIPPQRLALLDTATLHRGEHPPTRGPGCQHCALELLHEVATGRHAAAIPKGASGMLALFPWVNDGPWLDAAHRTAVLRPYLRHMLALDPASDGRRAYAVADYAVRAILPPLFERLGLAEHAAALRALAPIVDDANAAAAVAAGNRAADAASSAAAASRAGRPPVRASVAYAADAARLAVGAARAAGRVASRAAEAAALLAGATAHAAAAAADAETAADWELHVRGLLDCVCAIA
jgi:hypothetical protein